MQPVKHILHTNTFWLSHQRCLFWEEKKALILSDLHFGKTGHFRKSGIAIPQNVFKEDIQRLVEQITFFKPQQLIIVGDMFHSEANKELDLFIKWRKDFEQLHFHLIKGNHDILDNDWYLQQNIQTTEHLLQVNNFCFIHDVNSINNEELKINNYFFSGHIHPGITINGISKQSLRFPCFYFGKEYGVLPAFSRFTGLASIKPKKKEDVFAIVEKSIIKI
jgi:DNA ligase-associated metallophosphoesterase